MKKNYKKFDKVMIETAIIWSKMSYCEKRKVGAVLSKHGHILSIGFNGTKPGKENKCEDENGKTIHTNVIHAELNCIKRANERNIDLVGATLYCTTMPCITCGMEIVKNGIERVLFISEYKNLDGLKLLENNGVEVERYVGKNL